MAKQHIMPKDDKWQVKGEGNSKATKLFDTQEEAIAYAKQVAGNQDTQIVIHRADGTIRDTSGVRSTDAGKKNSAKTTNNDKKSQKAEKQKKKEAKKAAKEKAKKAKAKAKADKAKAAKSKK